MRQSEGWDIGLRRRIKESLSVKVFLWVFLSLIVCCMIIYIIVITVIPRRYQITSDKQLGFNTEKLAGSVGELSYETALKDIYNFCIQNNAVAYLIGDNETLNFGEIKADQLTSATSNIAVTVSFLDSDKEYTLVVSSISNTSEEITGIMIHYIPVIVGIIFFISALSGFICSRIIVKPIIRISEISRNISCSDMVWKCDIQRDDEIGILVSSLNTMSDRLSVSMDSLKNANDQLAIDVEKFKTLEEGRRNFFAAVSHELKTPLTILKGQLENMILGYGDYQNHDKYLPESLKTVEDIEGLVAEIIYISKMESTDIRGSLISVSLKSSVDDAIKKLSTLASEKDIRLYQNIVEDVDVNVNPNLWDKALSNIIGNAIRHSPCDEDVYIYIRDEGQGKKFVVENTGVFIPEDEIDQIFTPFYRADKSRNKSTGGSGLGLYIVKTVFDLHGFIYSLKNTGRGVAFVLKIK